MTEPSTAELAAELAALRAELLELRRQLADEVRTRRLIVEDEHGVERIDTRCDDERAGITINTFDADDKLGLGDPTQVSVHLDAELDITGNLDGKPSARGYVHCYTGENSFGQLEQRTTVETTLYDRVRTDRGRVALDQHRAHPLPMGESDR